MTDYTANGTPIYPCLEAAMSAGSDFVAVLEVNGPFDVKTQRAFERFEDRLKRCVELDLAEDASDILNIVDNLADEAEGVWREKYFSQRPKTLWASISTTLGNIVLRGTRA